MSGELKIAICLMKTKALKTLVSCALSPGYLLFFLFFGSSRFRFALKQSLADFMTFSTLMRYEVKMSI